MGFACNGGPHAHAFSCDSDAKVRALIEATCPPAGPLFHDMLTRDVTCIPPHSVYVCGFPCKAFSMLRRHATQFLQDASAKPFFATVAVLRQCRPRVAVFENVLGIRAVLPKVLRKLRQVAGYYIFVVPIDSVDLGEPVCRPRIYFVLVRQDCTISDDMEALCAIVRAGYASVCGKVMSHVCERMLPASSPEVRRLRRRKGARPSGTCADYLTTARQDKVWAKLRAKHPQGDLIADVSQSLSRSSPRAGGVCPTLKPRGIVMAQRAGRPIAPYREVDLSWVSCAPHEDTSLDRRRRACPIGRQHHASEVRRLGGVARGRLGRLVHQRRHVQQSGAQTDPRRARPAPRPPPPEEAPQVLVISLWDAGDISNGLAWGCSIENSIARATPLRALPSV